VGSPLVAGVVAQLAFWLLLIWAVVIGEIGWRGAGLFCGLWLAGYLGLPRIAWWTGGFVTTWVAVLDIALVFYVFKGDVKLS
jgi:hypothetical protein